MTHPAEWSLSILRENNDWLAVDKPAGLSVHNEEDETNLLKQLEIRWPGKKFYPVHRLDKETSGIQILALNNLAASELAHQFQGRQVEKFYQGIVAGNLADQGVWTEALTDQAEGWKNPAGPKESRISCETRYRKLRQSQYFTWLEFELITGRQHQIRKHCVLAGRALIGDSRYGNPKYNQKISKLYGFHRMALHCSKIYLPDQIEINCPVPGEFQLLFPVSN